MVERGMSVEEMERVIAMKSSDDKFCGNKK